MTDTELAALLAERDALITRVEQLGLEVAYQRNVADNRLTKIEQVHELLTLVLMAEKHL